MLGGNEQKEMNQNNATEAAQKFSNKAEQDPTSDTQLEDDGDYQDEMLRSKYSTPATRTRAFIERIHHPGGATCVGYNDVGLFVTLGKNGRELQCRARLPKGCTFLV